MRFSRFAHKVRQGGDIIATGYLQISVTAADFTKIIASANIRVYRFDNSIQVYEDFFLSNADGKTMKIPLYVSDSYADYQIEVRKKGYLTVQKTQRIFPDTCAFLSVHMDASKDTAKASPLDYGIPLPKTILVHLGSLDQTGETITVPFPYYLKNIACSQLYPTWPYEAIKAAVRAQLFMVKLIMDCGWYRQKGYDFDITSASHFDPVFIKDRIFFDPISRIVDEIVQDSGITSYNTLSAYPGHAFQLEEQSDSIKQLQKAINTIASQYPAIPVVVTDGIFQAGTRHAVCTFQRIFGLPADGILGKATWDILHSTAAQIEQDDVPENGLPSFPGTPLQMYSHGDDVLLMQHHLQLISFSYSSIPKPAADGVFLETTYHSVLAFQRLLGLAVDGIIAQMTWSEINQIYEELRTS